MKATPISPICNTHHEIFIALIPLPSIHLLASATPELNPYLPNKYQVC
jgi:hypothetical protein